MSITSTRQKNLFATTKLRKFQKNHELIKTHKIDIIHQCKGKKSLVAADMFLKHYTGNDNVLIPEMYLELCRWLSVGNSDYHPNNMYRQGRELVDRLKEAGLVDDFTGHVSLSDMSSAKAINRWKIEIDKKLELDKAELASQLNEALAFVEEVEEIIEESDYQLPENVILETIENNLGKNIIEISKSDFENATLLLNQTMDCFREFLSQLEKLITPLRVIK